MVGHFIILIEYLDAIVESPSLKWRTLCFFLNISWASGVGCSMVSRGSEFSSVAINARKIGLTCATFRPVFVGAGCTDVSLVSAMFRRDQILDNCCIAYVNSVINSTGSADL